MTTHIATAIPVQIEDDATASTVDIYDDINDDNNISDIDDNESAEYELPQQRHNHKRTLLQKLMIRPTPFKYRNLSGKIVIMHIKFVPFFGKMLYTKYDLNQIITVDPRCIGTIELKIPTKYIYITAFHKCDNEYKMIILHARYNTSSSITFYSDDRPAIISYTSDEYDAILDDLFD